MNGSEGLERLKPGGAPGRSVRQHWRWLRTLFRLPAWPLLARMGAFSKRSRGFWPWRSCVCFNGADLERFPAVLPELPSRTQLRIRPATLASVQSAFSTGTLRVICRFTWMNNVTQSARGLAQSKTLREVRERSDCATRHGVRQSSGALGVNIGHPRKAADDCRTPRGVVQSDRGGASPGTDHGYGLRLRGDAPALKRGCNPD
jgi:hypothetical protein